MLSEEAAAKNMATTIQKELINQLCDLNFTNLPNGYPQLTFGKIGDDDINITSAAVAELMNAGALTSDPNVEDQLRRMLHIPELPQEVHDAYDDIIKKDPGSLIKLPGVAPVVGTPAPDNTKPTPAPNPDDKSIKPDPKTTASRRQLISDVLTEFASDRSK
jgi:hypothetical protein